MLLGFDVEMYRDLYDFCVHNIRQVCCLAEFHRFFFSFLLAVLVTHGSCRYINTGTSTPFMNSRQLTGLFFCN